MLGVEPTATENEIRTAFRTKAKLLHPDAGGSESAFIELQEAFHNSIK